MQILKLNLSRDDDPTGQARNRANLDKKISQRLEAANIQVRNLFNQIPRQPRRENNLSLNKETFTVYDYEFSPEQQDQLESVIETIIILWLLQGQSTNKPIDYYSDDNIELSYRSGTQEVIRDANSLLTQISLLGLLLPSMPRNIDINTILLSQSYLDALNGYKSSFFFNIKGLSSKLSNQVFERIKTGIKSGKTPRNIIKDINGRFGVAESDAKRIVKTEINRINNNGRIDTINFINDTTSLNAAGRHRSALLPGRTRATHAARHNRLYTSEQQLLWWDSGSNRINCFCSFDVVFLDKDNKPIVKSS